MKRAGWVRKSDGHPILLQALHPPGCPHSDRSRTFHRSCSRRQRRERGRRLSAFEHAEYRRRPAAALEADTQFEQFSCLHTLEIGRKKAEQETLSLVGDREVKTKLQWDIPSLYTPAAYRPVLGPTGLIHHEGLVFRLCPKRSPAGPHPKDESFNPAGRCRCMPSGVFARSSTLFQEAFNRWSQHNAPRLGAALAFYTLFSLAPLLAICAMLLAAVFGANVANTEITTQFHSWMGDNAANTIAALIAAHPQRSGVVSGAIVLLALFFGASAVFIELHSALNEMWDARTPHIPRWARCQSRQAKSFPRSRWSSRRALFLIASTAGSMLISTTGQLIGRFRAASPKVLETMNVAMSSGFSRFYRSNFSAWFRMCGCRGNRSSWAPCSPPFCSP